MLHSQQRTTIIPKRLLGINNQLQICTQKQHSQPDSCFFPLQTHLYSCRINMFGKQVSLFSSHGVGGGEENQGSGQTAERFYGNKALKAGAG